LLFKADELLGETKISVKLARRKMWDRNLNRGGFNGQTLKAIEALFKLFYRA